MAIRVPTTDIRVKIGRRFADVSFESEGGMRIQYPKTDPILLNNSDLENAVLGSSVAAICLISPRVIAPGTKTPVPSIVFSKTTDDAFDALTNGLLRMGSVDARRVPHMSTVCERTSVQILPGNAIVVWTARACTYCPAEHVVLQRTKGGMSTYDVHILHRGSDTVTTVDMLPHSTMHMWERAMGESHVFDVGADPISSRAIRHLYDPEDGWAVGDAFDDASSDDDNMSSASEYEEGCSESSEESCEYESCDDSSEASC